MFHALIFVVHAPAQQLVAAAQLDGGVLCQSCNVVQLVGIGSQIVEDGRKLRVGEIDVFELPVSHDPENVEVRIGQGGDKPQAPATGRAGAEVEGSLQPGFAAAKFHVPIGVERRA